MSLKIETDFPYVIRLYRDPQCRNDFLGSGLLIGRKHVLTCAHVADHREGDEKWYAKDCTDNIAVVVGFDFLEESDRNKDPVGHVDLALLELESELGNSDPIGALAPATVVHGLTNLRSDMTQNELRAVGGIRLDSTETGQIQSILFNRDGTPFDLQVAGGIWAGFSGGPVLMRLGQKWYCIGIAWMGRKEAATSRILMGDTVYQFLRVRQLHLRAADGVRFVDFDSLTQEIEKNDAADREALLQESCEAVLREYSEACAANWEQEKKTESLERFVEPRLAIRRDPKIVDRSESKESSGTSNDHESLLTPEEKELPGEAMAVEQYRRLFERRPKRPGAGARLCVTEDAGSGKSVFTRHLRAVLCGKAGQAAIFNGQPGLVVRWEGRVESWPPDIRVALEKAIKSLCDSRSVTPKQVLDYAIEHRRVCLILDALDQVTNAVIHQQRFKKSEILDEIFRFLKSDDGVKCHVVVTGRSYAVTRDGDGPRFAADTWVFATLESFDEGQQKRYLSDFLGIRDLTDFIPSYGEVSELMSVPVILSLIADIAIGIAKEDRIPLVKVCLDQFKTRGDVYRKAHEELADRAVKNGIQTDSTAKIRWEAILSAAAFAMMCDENQRRNYAVIGQHPVANFRAATAKWGYNVEGQSLRIRDQDWKKLTRFSQLTNHVSVENCDEMTVSWKHRGWMEYFAGLYLARYAPPEAAAYVSAFCNDPDWYWTWRFAIEMPVDVSNEQRRTAALAHLFRRPTAGRRPNELIYRAWEVMDSTAAGKLELEQFGGEYQDLLKAGNRLADQIETSFRPCPPDPVRDSLTFLMGAPESDTDAYYNEKPQISRKVEPFLMSNAPITKSQFWLYDPGHRDDPAFADRLQKYSPQDDCPVIYVTWYDAWCFARWCGSRLPTEMEWEYACRAGTETRYWWGNEVDESKCTINTSHTTPAKQSHANLWELMEMSGNVWEWCDTSYVEDLARLLESDNTGEFRVLRGGSFDFNPQRLRSADRDGNAPDNRGIIIGFRVSRTRIGF